ncbi:MAG: signal peptidase I [Candidatus Scatovivens sp.]
MNDTMKNILEWIYCIIIAFVLALLFRYFILTPTVVKQRSMFPTLKENQRLILNRTYRITGLSLKRGDIVTFEAPSEDYLKLEADQSNPIAKYNNEPTSAFGKFVYYTLEITKKSYIKRVIGLEGEHVKIENGKVYINGQELEEEYLSDDVVTTSDIFYDFVVPEGYVFCMGDNRSYSKDCRELGCIPKEKIEGIVVYRFWPLNVWGKIN